MGIEFEDENNIGGSLPGNSWSPPVQIKKAGFISRIFMAVGLGSDADSAQVFIFIVAVIIFIISGLIYFL